MSAFAAALATRSETTAPSSDGCHARSTSAAGPPTQPSFTVIRPPHTEKTRPVISRDSALPSQTTRGAMFSGARVLKPPSYCLASSLTEARSSVIRVRAVGAMALTVTP